MHLRLFNGNFCRFKNEYSRFHVCKYSLKLKYISWKLVNSITHNLALNGWATNLTNWLVIVTIRSTSSTNQAIGLTSQGFFLNLLNKSFGSQVHVSAFLIDSTLIDSIGSHKLQLCIEFGFLKWIEAKKPWKGFQHLL